MPTPTLHTADRGACRSHLGSGKQGAPAYLSADASDLGLSPGCWPKIIVLYRTLRGEVIDAQVFRWIRHRVANDGESMGAVYRCNDLDLRVFND